MTPMVSCIQGLANTPVFAGCGFRFDFLVIGFSFIILVVFLSILPALIAYARRRFGKPAE